ncbi:AraC family transcriptional regulator [Micromonospora sp. CPCC 205371]|nr:AraC family transcriptional regulator [Micromonospora sp. CPCC 205371]
MGSQLVAVHLDAPPDVVNLGVGVHGTTSRQDVFQLPDLWQMHLYRYHADIVVDGVAHAIRPGHVSLVPPGVVVRYLYRGRSEHLYAHLRLAPHGAATEIPVMQDAGTRAAVLSDLMQHAIDVSARTPKQAVAQIWAALWRVAHLTESTEDRRRHAAIGAAVAYIESNLAGPLAVPAIAQAAGISHNHLTRLFRAEMGNTVVGYIRARRLARAEHLLRASTLPIAAVAASVGIRDLQAFNKACRQVLHASPRAIRAGTDRRG